MTVDERVSVLIYGAAAHILWCTTGFAEKSLIERYFVNDSEQLKEVLREHVPEIALVTCLNPITCGDVVSLCRRANPGILVIVVKSGESPVSPLDGTAGSVFAAVSQEKDGVEFVAAMKKAVAFVIERRKLQEKSERRRLRREHPASWLMDREARERDSKLEWAASLIRNILHSASQGLGIGSVLTYIDLLQMMMPQLQKESEVFASLLHNARAARAWLASFENILAGLQKEYPQQVIQDSDIQAAVEAALAATEKFRAIKDQLIDRANFTALGSSYGNREALQEILSELLLNAYKYSPAGSEVRLLSYTTNEISAIAVVNEIERKIGGPVGIPAEFEEKIFEPFFRVNNAIDDRFAEQKYGLGVGLTLADHAALQCGGRLYVYEIEAGGENDSKAAAVGRRVVAELVLQKV